MPKEGGEKPVALIVRIDSFPTEIIHAFYYGLIRRFLAFH
jgi:hypothetical protein